jgi:protein SCO1/2
MQQLLRARALMAVVFACGLSGAAVPALAQHAGHTGHATAPASEAAQVPVTVENVSVLDAAGRPLHFASDVVGDKIVAVTFVYTSCTTVCPVMSAIFANVQAELGERLGRDVRLITVSIDPANDSPARMAETAKRFGAKSGWLWITGSVGAIETVLKGLGVYTPDIVSHPPTVLIGDGRKRQWTRLYGFVAPEEVTGHLSGLLAARAHSGHDHHAVGGKL